MPRLDAEASESTTSASYHRLRYASHFVVLTAPIFDLFHGIVHMLAETFEPDGSIEALDIGVVRRLAQPGEVQRDPVGVGPEVKLLRGKLAALIDADGV